MMRRKCLTNRKSRMAKSKNSRFITIEGGEGSGKTTLISKLRDKLIQHGYEVITTREPGGTRFGEMMRDRLLSRNNDLAICPQAELLLFLAARAQHIEELILPALEQGKIVICDRFQDSTIAYQGAARELGFDYVQELCKLSCKNFAPDVTLLLDIDPIAGLERCKKMSKEHAAEGELDRIESETLAFHRKVREGMLELARQEPERIKVIDAGRTPEQVFDVAWQKIGLE